MRSWTKSLAVFLCAMLITCVALAADQMTAKDVVRLKKLGFSDTEIKAAVDKSDNKIEFTDADIQELKAAGASDELIRALRGGPKELSVKAVVDMVKAGRTVDQVLDAMAATPSKYKLSPEDAMDLSRQNVPTAILLALKGNPLGMAELKLLADSKPSASVYEKLAAMLGCVKQKLAPADALALSQAGVPDDVVEGLMKGRAGTAADSSVSGDMREYQHIAHYFTIRYPKSWNLVRDVDEENVDYCVTPETGKTKSLDLNTAVEVNLLTVDESSPMAGMDAVTMLKHLMPAFLATEPGLKTQGEVTVAKVGKLPAAHIALKGSIKKKTGTFIGDLYLAVDRKMMYTVACRAPDADYPTYKDTMQRIVEESDFGLIPSSTRGPTQEAGDIVGRYKNSVVCVMAFPDNSGNSWSGTGFVIQKDGYVATNAHVALDLETGKPAARYVARFDEGTHHKDLPLTFIGARFHMSHLKLHHGVDVALFKLPPGEYTPLPLTPLRDVELGDAVVTMGFPHVYDFATMDMFTTGGVVTRFNRGLDGSVESIYMDAKITHGNSGGPCISRVTGGVIGLNTFGMNINTERTAEAQHENDLVGYEGLVPIETFMSEFPIVAELGLNPDNDSLDFCDCYGLARLYMDQGRNRASVEMAERACKLQPRSADAHCLLGACRLRAALQAEGEISDFKPTVEQAVSAIQEALECEPDHQSSLLLLSNLYLDIGDMIKATQYADHAVKAHPDDFQSYIQQGVIYDALKRYDDALAAANKAKELAHDVRADAHVLAGGILYEEGKLDEGKAEFALASQIHPTNLVARLGIGKYYELKNNYESALVEYGRVDADIPDNPAVESSLGRCYYQLKQYDGAAADYEKVLDRCEKLGATPLLEVFLNFGSIELNIKKSDVAAANVYAKGLGYYGNSPLGANLHLRLAHIFRNAKFPGIAFSDLCRAASLAPDNADVKKELAAKDLPLMSMDDILTLVTKIQFSPYLVADMVAHTPLDFKLIIKNDEDVAKLEKEGLPEEVLQAIIDSNKAFPPPARKGTDAEAQGPGQDNTPPANPGEGVNNPPATPPQQGPAAADPKHPAELAGAWVAQYRTNDGTLVIWAMSLNINGRYGMWVTQGTKTPQADKGVWYVTDQGLVTKSDADASADVTPINLNGDTMEADIKNVGRLKFIRQKH